MLGCSTEVLFESLTQRTVEAKGDKVKRDLEVAEVYIFVNCMNYVSSIGDRCKVAGKFQC